MQQGETKGKLTIFLGALPGVGKTFAMLEAAQTKFNQGADVVVGYVETHNCQETEKLLKGLPKISPRKSWYDGKVYYEIDLDEILERRPQIVVIDDIAHINKPGSRHVYRYQDIEELLQEGINVYTTLNIYNVESLNDIVNQITGIRVKETIPDRILDLADQIKLIDISPEELIERYKEGKFSRKLFRIGNINALRELALRFTAQRVDKELIDYMKLKSIKGPWPAGERILACISASPFSTQVIRTARRIATGLKAEWIAAYVETPKNMSENEFEKEQLAKNMRLAEELGAEVITLTGNDVASELLNLVKRKNITQIVIGKPIQSPLGDLLKNSVVDKIIRGSQNISIHVIPSRNKVEEKEKKFKLPASNSSVFPYIWTLILIFLITALNKILNFDLVNIALLYLLPVLISAVYWGRGPSIMASLLGVLSFDIFFIPPFLSITVEDLRYLLSFGIFLLVAVITGTYATRLRNQAVISRKREERTAALYSLSRKMVMETDIEGILNTVVKVIAETMNSNSIIYMPDEKGVLIVKAATVLPSDRLLDKSERIVAKWVFEHGQMAGKGTQTLGEAHGFYLPLKFEFSNIGVLGIMPKNPEKYFSSDQKRLLEAFANLAALAIVRLELAEEAQKAHYLMQSEKLRTALLNSISHELRTPLSSILGAVTSLLEENDIYSEVDRRSLLQAVNEGALRMNRLVGNLLDMARLESGMLKLKKEWCDIQEIIEVALRRIQKFLEDRKIIIDIPLEISLIKADFALIEQVIVNLLDNAIKYSPNGSEIKIRVYQDEKEIKVAVKDRGSGISEVDREKIFDKFYRVYHPKQVTGTGLGLSICKGIIEAHGGRIWASVRPGGGSVFTFTIPFGKKGPVNFPGVEGGVEDE